MAAKIESLTRDADVKSLPEVFNEMRFALLSLRDLRQHAVDSGEPWSDHFIVTLGLFLNHQERLIEKAGELTAKEG